MRKKKLVGPTSSSIWQKVTNLGTLRQMHGFLVVNGLNSNPRAMGDLMYVAAVTVYGTIDYAHQLFDQIPEPDTFLWNTMIRGSAQSVDPLKAVYLYAQMGRTDVRPDNFTFPFVIKACTRLAWVDMGRGVHGRVSKLGFESSTFARNSLIHFHANVGDIGVARGLFDDAAKRDVVAWSAMTSGYARRGEMENARRVFDRMPVKDMVSWNVMITAYAKTGDIGNARRLFEQVPRKDVVTWNAMISGYVLCKLHKQALEMYEEMRSVGEVADEVTMLSLLSACVELGDLETGKKIHRTTLEMGFKELDVLLSNALIDMYAKCGKIDIALEVFRNMREKDISSWNSVLGGLALHGCSKQALDLFLQLRRDKIAPDGITFVAVLIACSHTGNIEQGQDYFKLMQDVYGIEPNIRHYGCMVDMLGRAGLLNEAFRFVDDMRMEPNAIIWRTLLGACKVHGQMELGMRAYRELLERRRDQSGDYVLCSNMYASVNKWDEFENVRNLMDENGVHKESGCSVIEAPHDEFMKFLFKS